MAETLKPFAFVLMPFSEEFDDVYKLGIQAVSRELEIVAERVDEQNFSETILERIYRQIEQSDFVIADMSGKNPNVFYEVGYAHAKKKPVVLLTKNADDIPFDLKHHRHLIYGDSISGLRDSLRPELNWQKSQLLLKKTKPITVSIKTEAPLLVDTQYRSEANFNFIIDLHNSSENKSPEIEAIYIHAEEGWMMFQDDMECASTESNVTPFKFRHFVKVPVSRLSPGAWAQAKIKNKKVMWRRMSGEEKQSEYEIKGVGLIEVVTSEGSYKEEFTIELTVEEFPF